jgi:adenylate kinase
MPRKDTLHATDLHGPPGAGKGTQSAAVSHRFDVPAISPGHIFRANVSAGTALGVEAQTYMSAGDYVPDELTNAMVRDRLTQPDCRRGFLLDSYPRTLEQVKELDRTLADLDERLDGVLMIDTDPDTLIRRLLDRARREGRADDTESTMSLTDSITPSRISSGSRCRLPRPPTPAARPNAGTVP